MLTRTKIALAVALIVGTASAALANDIDESVSAAQAAREMRGNQLPWWWNTSIDGRAGSGGNAYGYVAPSNPAHRTVQNPKTIR